MKTGVISVRVEQNVKDKAEETLALLGLNMADAISVYLRQIILCEGIPFEIKVPKFSDEMLKSIDEAEEIMKHPEDYPSYKSVDALMEALNEE